MEPSAQPDDLDLVAALAEPVRRRLYEVVAGRGGPVDRDQAAAGAGVGRALAAFHLDRLVEAGLLEVEYRRRTGRSGPGAGRPAKYYRRPASRELAVSLPPRRYDLAARILAVGIEGRPDVSAAVLEAAYREGVRIAEAYGPADRAGLIGILAAQGYEPAEDPDGGVRLRNCPFRSLVADHRALTCSMNHALLRGVLAGSGATGGGVGLAAEARPREGSCCVAIVPVA